MNSSEMRQEIDRLMAAGDDSAAAALLQQLWSNEHSTSIASFLVQRFEQLRPSLSLRHYRLAILRSFTVEPMIPLLRAAAFCAGIDLDLHLSDFNAHAQAILDPDSALYRFAPDAVILAVQARDIAPDLWHRFSSLSADEVQNASLRVAADFRNWVRAFREHTSAHLVAHNLEQPARPSSGVLDQQVEPSQSATFAALNRELRGIAAASPGVHVLDYDALVARHGRQAWHDERKWLTVRLPVAAGHLDNLAQEWMKFLHPLTGRIAKVLVVDLDNTLWGGVIGEDGMAGIQLGAEYPGAAFQQLQQALLDHHHRGIVLAVCSKNNLDDAQEVIERHPGMLLRPAHFAAMRINWGDKSQNLREIAHALNVGTDALAFLDDNPVERQQVRRALPEVHVIDLPRDPMQFAQRVRECPLFERLTLSTEDRQRGQMYQAQRERDQLEQTVSSREDFYRSLQQEAEIAALTPGSLARVAQLTNKTNQFNLTTRRYSEQEIQGLMSTPGWECHSLRVTDRFGDNGLVGVAITHLEGTICEIDTFLLSCRVIGRTVETAFLSFLASRAHAQGAHQLQGWYRPSKKNAPARDFYPAHGFTLSLKNGDGALWTLDLGRDRPACPEWIRLHTLNGDRQP